MYGRPHWSFSSLSQYLRCPLQYYFERILGLPRRTVGSSLILGSTVHSVLEQYHRALKSQNTIDRDRLQRSFTDSWNSRENQSRIAYKAGENRSDLIAVGMTLIDLYLNEPPPTDIVAVEQEIIAPIANSRGQFLETPVVSIADLITAEGERLKVTEFKTSGRAYSELEAETSLQPTFYSNAVHQAYGRPVEVDYAVLVKTKTPRLQRLNAPRNEEASGRLGDIIENIEHAVKANIYYPVENPLNCSSCPFRQPCREWSKSDANDSTALSACSQEELAC